jgi:hypothetical protein
MDYHRSRLELLPNETFIEIFQYMEIKDIFRAFDNLNHRFNILLRSVNNLIFKLWDGSYINVNSFLPYIDTLVILCRIDIQLSYFPNIRHLNLIQLTDQFLIQLNSQTLPFLEYLFIKSLSHNPAYILYDKIFSNTLPNLKSCYVCQSSVLERNNWSEQLLLLRNLQVGLINLSAYETILSVCPNLNFLKFRLKSNETSVVVKPHSNLKRMIIKLDDFIQLNNDYAMNICLSFVPCLERLDIHQDFFQVNIPTYKKSVWYASLIARYLSLLRRFKYSFHVWYTTGHDAEVIDSFDEMKRHFQYVHNDRYQSKFRVHLTC